MASSLDLTCQSQKPAISSVVSGKGPSMTVRFPLENQTRAPFELGWSPSPASRTPGSGQFFVVLPHLLEELRVWEYACFRLLVRFNQNHESRRDDSLGMKDQSNALETTRAGALP